MPTLKNNSLKLVICLLSATVFCCTHLDKFQAVDKLSDDLLPAAKYVIGAGDILNIQVLNQSSLTTRATVRSDGRISFPFLNDVEAAGKSPEILAHDMQQALKQYLQMPVVSVSVEISKPMSISVLGNVVKPGVVAIENGAGVLQVLATAGGLTDLASDHILVIRNKPDTRVLISYRNLVRGYGKAQAFRIRDGDVIVVE